MIDKISNLEAELEKYKKDVDNRQDEWNDLRDKYKGQKDKKKKLKKQVTVMDDFIQGQKLVFEQ